MLDGATVFIAPLRERFGILQRLADKGFRYHEVVDIEAVVVFRIGNGAGYYSLTVKSGGAKRPPVELKGKLYRFTCGLGSCKARWIPIFGKVFFSFFLFFNLAVLI